MVTYLTCDFNFTARLIHILQKGNYCYSACLVLFHICVSLFTIPEMFITLSPSVIYLDPSNPLKVLHVSVGEGVGKAEVGVVPGGESVDVEPHGSNVIAEDVVVVALAAGLDHAQVGHGQVARLLAVHLVKVFSCLSGAKKLSIYRRSTY